MESDREKTNLRHQRVDQVAADETSAARDEDAALRRGRKGGG